MQPDDWMTPEETSKKRTLNLCPWLIAVLALVLYAVTLNHWVSLASLPWVAKITGWDWHPTNLSWRPSYIAPLYQAITYPFKLLPLNVRPIALNCLSAIFAALTLATLVRSIHLLPHDRTREQRQREGGEFSLLSGSFAWLPPVLAVLALAFELTFWENATVATSEMLDLLIFAHLIRCLLEYRISQKESWLTQFALIYGLGMTNSWALLGYFPFFLVALIWIKGVSFFNVRFILRTLGFGLLGLIPYLLMAWVASSAYAGGSFWSQLHAHLSQQKNFLLGLPRSPAIVLSIPTVLALIFAGIRWPSFHGEVSAAGIMFTNFMFRLVHIVFFVFAVVYFFDFKYSPRMLATMTPMLTFYYMAALSVGYFSGYILLVFGRPPARLHEPTPGAVRGLQLLIFALPWVALVALPVGLLFGLPYKLRESNWAQMQAQRAPVLKQFAVEMANSFPAQSSVVLGDDAGRLQLAEAGWELLHNSAGPAFVETGMLGVGDYVRYLATHQPVFNRAVPDVTKVPKFLSKFGEIQLLQKMPQPVCYLEPSFGAFFERFYLKPNGLVFELTPLAPYTLLAPPLTEAEVANNTSYWQRLSSGALKQLATNKRASDARVIAAQCSRAADYIGVVFQRENHLKEANQLFSDALAFNPKNVIARINQQFNEHLRAGSTVGVEPSDEFTDEAKRYGWQGLLAVDGPPDEPELDFQFGQLIAAGNYLRQASEYFLRRLALRPNDAAAQIAMAKTYVDMERPDDALAALQKAREHAKPGDVDELTRIEAFAWYGKHDEQRAEDLLKSAAAIQDKNTGTRLSTLAEFYRVLAYNASRAGKTAEAKTRFNEALATLDQRLKWLSAPERARTSEADMADVLMRKAEMQVYLGAYADAVANLTKALDLQPDSPRALINRAIAQLRSGKYDDARHDYLRLEKILPTPSFAVYYGLGEIASKTNDRSGAIKNFKKYLKYAPQNSDEAKQVRQRLEKLERGA